MASPQDSTLIEARAYQIWEQEGRPEGRALEHWRRAELELQTQSRVAVPDATGNEDPDSDLASDGVLVQIQTGMITEFGPDGRAGRFW